MNETTKYKLLSFIRYLGDSFFYPFFALYLSSQNLVESEIGFILSITPLVSILMNPIYSALCKDVKTTRSVLKIITILEAIMILVVAFSNNFMIITIVVVLLAIFGSCHYGLMDSITVIYASERQISYSNIRIWGSAAYIIGTTLGGFIFKWNAEICFGIACSLFIISGLMYQLIKPIELSEQEVKKEKPHYKTLLRNKTFIFFLLFYVLFMGTTNAADYFFPVYLESRGVGVEIWGIVYSFLVGIEVITIWFANRFLKHANPNALLLVAATCLFSRLFVNFTYAPIPVIFAFTAFRGLGWALILHISFQYVVQIVGEKAGTFAIMMMTLCQSIYVAIFNNVDGIIIERTGTYQIFYLIMSVIAGCVVALGVFRLIHYHKINKRQQN